MISSWKISRFVLEFSSYTQTLSRDGLQVIEMGFIILQRGKPTASSADVRLSQRVGSGPLSQHPSSLFPFPLLPSYVPFDFEGLHFLSE